MLRQRAKDEDTVNGLIRIQHFDRFFYLILRSIRDNVAISTRAPIL
jgi:hypothetical protein